MALSAQKVRDALAFADSIIDTIPHPILVLDESLRVVRASRAFCSTFAVTNEETAGKLLYELDNGQWDIPKLRSLLEEIIPRNTTVRDFEVEHTFEQVGRKVMLLNARKLDQVGAKMILLIIEDVTDRNDAEATSRQIEDRITGYSKILRDMTERRHAEEAMRINEERSRLIVEATRDYAILTIDFNGLITSWFPGAEAVLDWTAAEAIGQNVSMTFTAEDRAAGVPEKERLVAREKGSAPDVRWHLRKDGEKVFIDGVIRALGDGFLKIGQDVTDRRRADERLRENEERLRVALSAGKMGTWLWRIREDEQIVDDSLRRLMGMSLVEQSMSLDRFLQAVHPDDRTNVRKAFESSLGGGEINLEFRVTWPDGSVHWLKDQGKVFFGPEGPLYMAGAVMDITERKRMEQELREADRRKDEFLAMLGHELRNPLVPLRSTLEVLRRKGDGHAPAYAMMDRQVVHLIRLVDDLLDVSRITRGLVELRKEPVNLGEIANQAVEMVTPAAEKLGHELFLTLPRKPVRVEGDSTRLIQIVFNLLNNAVKYTDPKGSIWLTVEREKETAVVRIRDNGSGMSPELVPKVFDLFTQGERSPDRSQGGLGLGLTLVKRLVEMHGGTVEASSAGIGKGSEFIVRLPMMPVKDEKPQAKPVGPPPAEVQVDRVLLIDDNFDVAESMMWMFEGIAKESKMVHSGQAALEIVADYKPDVIVCDIGMPRMDGYETCRRLRQAPGLEKVMIAAVSGYENEEDRRRSKEAGFDRHLVKPISRATLEELVKSMRKDG